VNPSAYFKDMLSLIQEDMSAEGHITDPLVESYSLVCKLQVRWLRRHLTGWQQAQAQRLSGPEGSLLRGLPASIY
jgi:hypothetical protein